MSVVTRDTIKRYEAGDHISDEEMLGLIRVYEDVVEGCMVLGSRFYLAYTEANRNLVSLRGFAHNRGLK